MPTIKKATENFTLGAGDLTLKVANYDGQAGLSSAVLLPTKILAVGAIIKVLVGNHDECKGKQLFIDADIRDVLDQTNNTSLTIALSDITNSQSYFYTEPTPGPGEAVIYQITINLI